MPVNSVSGYTNAAESSTPNSTDSSGMFMQLLLTQLKAQDPMSPMDANQMMGQLMQFNTLGEITQIRELLEKLVQVTS